MGETGALEGCLGTGAQSLPNRFAPSIFFSDADEDHDAGLTRNLEPDKTMRSPHHKTTGFTTLPEPVPVPGPSRPVDNGLVADQKTESFWLQDNRRDPTLDGCRLCRGHSQLAASGINR